ncbi:sugar ABC transporter substrate-binding protein [Zongyangia hominis]
MVVTIFAGCAAKEESSSSQSSSTPAGDSSSTGGDAKEGPYTFGYSAMTLNNPFFVYIGDTAKAVVEGKGDKFVSADPQFDQSRQISQIEDMVTQGIDVLLLNPVDNKGIRPALDACQKANIPIVNFDADVYDTDMVESILVSNNKQAGYLVGQKVVKDFPDGTKLAILDSPTAKSTLDRVAGFMQALEEAGKDKYPVVYQQDGKGSTQDSLPLAENCLQANPDVGAFFAGNDPSAMGAVAALEAAGKVGEIKVYGIDGSPEGKTAIKKGQMHGTGAQSPKAIAEQSVEVAYKILAGETVEKNILVDVFLIDDTNVDQYGTDSWQ